MKQDIYDIAREIFRYEPGPPNSIQLEIVNQSEPSIVFEILSILLCECLEMKLPGIIRNNRNMEIFILNLRQYFNSFGINFNYQIILNNQLDFYQILPFQVNRTYNNFGIRTEYQYYDFFLPYEPGIHESDNLKQFFISINVRGLIFRLNFDYFLE